MKGEFTEIIEAAPDGGYRAICPEVPGENGQGKTVDEDRVEDAKGGLPGDAIQIVVAI